ncbi:tRNA dihydrouridine synthase [Mucor velutinosus]|uniref:tRNA dihydrouridine synthase n=1 Tax=Mucor velutinosus TaxID=708070 RepID=A0AAN7DBZ8_9FUNG|nr:tRNA dihydrouridine synthase [Mucor velutinosus]
MKILYLVFTSVCFSQVSYAATGTLRVYDKTIVNPKAGILKIPSDAPPGSVPSIDNKTDNSISIYGNSDCSEIPLEVLLPDRATVDFKSAWGGCLKIAA